MYDLELNRSFKAPVTRLFKAWSDPEFMQRWFAPGAMTVPEAEADFRVGGRYRVVMLEPNNEQHIVSGEYLEIVENQKLRFTWQWAGSEVRTEVELRFRATDSGSELHLLHRQFPDTDARDRHNHGWNGCLEKLVSVVNAG